MELEHKGYIIAPIGYSLYQVKSKGKGSVPLDLRGNFTSKWLARKAVDQYGMRDKGETDEQKQPIVRDK